MTYKRERSAWRAMRARCLNPKSKSWKHYGGAGISICARWLESFPNFLQDMGPAPTPRHWLGRLNVQGNYEPGNCVWTTAWEQQNRRAYCTQLTISGRTLTAAQVARLPGQPTRVAVLYRAKAGVLLENPPAARLDKRSIWLTHDGQTLPLPEWARRIGMPPWTLWRRMRRGEPVERILHPGRLAPRRTGAPDTR